MRMRAVQQATAFTARMRMRVSAAYECMIYISHEYGCIIYIVHSDMRRAKKKIAPERTRGGASERRGGVVDSAQRQV
jgi:hypothetical protein